MVLQWSYSIRTLPMFSSGLVWAFAVDHGAGFGGFVAFLGWLRWVRNV